MYFKCMNCALGHTGRQAASSVLCSTLFPLVNCCCFFPTLHILWLNFTFQFTSGLDIFIVLKSSCLCAQDSICVCAYLFSQVSVLCCQNWNQTHEQFLHSDQFLDIPLQGLVLFWFVFQTVFFLNTEMWLNWKPAKHFTSLMKGRPCIQLLNLLQRALSVF